MKYPLSVRLIIALYGVLLLSSLLQTRFASAGATAAAPKIQMIPTRSGPPVRGIKVSAEHIGVKRAIEQIEARLNVRDGRMKKAIEALIALKRDGFWEIADSISDSDATADRILLRTLQERPDLRKLLLIGYNSALSDDSFAEDAKPLVESDLISAADFVERDLIEKTRQETMVSGLNREAERIKNRRPPSAPKPEGEEY